MSGERRRIDPAVLENLLRDGGLIVDKTERSWVVNCPICNKDKLYFLKQSGRFVCWVCKDDFAFEGAPEYALTKLIDLPIKTIQGLLYGETVVLPPVLFMDITLDDLYADEEKIPEDLQADLNPIIMPIGVVPIGSIAGRKGLSYLEGRGFTKEMAQEYDLSYWPEKRRVIFPVKRNGVLVGYQARTIGKSEWFDETTGQQRRIPKILTSEGLAREKCLMFEHRLEGLDHVVLTEGPVDAIKAHLCGGNVCTMGKAVSTQQIELLRNRGVRKFYLALDPDAASSTAKLVDALSDLETYMIEPPKGREDLGASTFEEVYQQFLKAPQVKPYNIFLYFRDPWY